MKNRYVPPVIILLSALLFAGCYGVDENFKSVRNVTLKEYGKHFSTDIEFALGGFELWLAEEIVSIAEDDEIAADIINCVSQVQVGTYKRRGNYELPTNKLLKKIDKQMDRKGWKYIVKSYEKDQMAAVYLNKDADKMLKELFVVQIDDEEMTIVHVTGDLERVIETIIREEGIFFDRHEGKVIAGR